MTTYNREMTDSLVTDAAVDPEQPSQATATVSSSTMTASHEITVDPKEECQSEHATDNESNSKCGIDVNDDKACDVSYSEMKAEESLSCAQVVPTASPHSDGTNESSSSTYVDTTSPDADELFDENKTSTVDTGDGTAVESAAATNKTDSEAPTSLPYKDEVDITTTVSNNQTSTSNEQSKPTSLEIGKSISNDREDDFEAIELIESSQNSTSQGEIRDTSLEEQAVLLNHDQLQHTTNSDIPTTSSTPSNNNKIRKKLRHPLLTPLTKLPWDRLATAAGTCDLLFNCKYSMRQVEDEVREEKKTIQYDIEEEEEEDVCDVDCDVQELGLHCCSMMDDDSDDEGGAQQQQHVKSEAPREDMQPCEDRGNLLAEEEQKRKSWKGSNPTVDMMLYKTFLEE